MRVPPWCFNHNGGGGDATFPLVVHLNLNLRPQIIVLRLDEGNQQQIYMGEVCTTPLMVKKSCLFHHGSRLLGYLSLFFLLLVHWFGH